MLGSVCDNKQHFKTGISPKLNFMSKETKTESTSWLRFPPTEAVSMLAISFTASLLVFEQLGEVLVLLSLISIHWFCRTNGARTSVKWFKISSSVTAVVSSPIYSKIKFRLSQHVTLHNNTLQM